MAADPVNCALTGTHAAGGCDVGSSRLIIDLAAIRANYGLLAGRVAPARCGAVVKADAYGLGINAVAPALYRAGCRLFFVAQFREAVAARAVLPADATLFILNGLAPGEEAPCADAGFIPVLNATSQVSAWRTHARARGCRLPAALQIDSGMSRLGLEPEKAAALAQDAALPREIDLRLIMTHLACADEPARDASADQLRRFQTACAYFPAVPASIANSGGTFLSPDFRLDVARPGVSLYGVAPGAHAQGLRPVVRLDARILQIRHVTAGTGVGYGLDYVAPGPRRLATIAIGYGDGWPRSLGGVGAAWHGATRLPIVGRVSMDSLTVDISALPEAALAEGDFVSLVGPAQSLDDVARDAGTIAYEILTRLGPRHVRIYLDDEQEGLS